MENGAGCFGGIAYTCGCHKVPAFRKSGERAGSAGGGECDSNLPPLSNSGKEDPLVTVVLSVAVDAVFSITQEAISVIPHTFQNIDVPMNHKGSSNRSFGTCRK